MVDGWDPHGLRISKEVQVRLQHWAQLGAVKESKPKVVLKTQAKLVFLESD